MSELPIAVDAMGGDNAPAAIVEGAVRAARRLGLWLTLVGQENAIRGELARHGAIPPRVRIQAAASVVGMDDHATKALRHQRDSSIAVGIDLVKRGEASAFLSAGNTGAVMSLATLMLGRRTGIDRPALGTVFPCTGGRFLLLDVGANADTRPAYLVQWAELGSGYAKQALGVQVPRVALLNIGEEAGKGDDLRREVHERLLTLSGISFLGNIEGKDLTRGLADVVVTDGFTGNVAIKTAEGTAEFILRELRASLTSSLRYKLAAMALRPAFSALRARIDYADYGAAPLLGLNGVVLIAHGRSNAHAIETAVRVASETVAALGVDAHSAPSRAAGSGDAS